MSNVTFSKANGKRSKVELVVDRKVVDQAYIDADNPIAFFSAEYVEIANKSTEKGALEEAVAKKKRENNIKRAEAYLSELFRLLATIDETDPDAVDELLEILAESVEESKADIRE